MNANKNEYTPNQIIVTADKKDKTNDNEKYKIKITNKRQFNFFQWFVLSNENMRGTYLFSLPKNIKRLNSISRLSIVEASKIIQEVIDVHYHHNNDSIKYYCWKVDEFLDSLLSEKEFDWFKTNADACYFVWLNIKNFHPELSNEFMGYYLENMPHSFERKVIDANGNQVLETGPTNFLNGISNSMQFPVSHQERYDAIVNYLDRVPASLQSRLFYIKNIREQWHFKRSNRKEINIPLSDEALCEWAWQYMHQKTYPRKRVYTETTVPTKNEGASEKSTFNSEDSKNIASTTDGETHVKKGYVVKEFGPDNQNPYPPAIEWRKAFNLIQPQTPAETYLAVNAVWFFYINNTPNEAVLLQQFRRARDTYLTRRNKCKK